MIDCLGSFCLVKSKSWKGINACCHHYFYHYEQTLAEHMPAPHVCVAEYSALSLTTYVNNRLTMVAGLQLALVQKHQPHMTLDVCWHQVLFPDQILMILTLRCSQNAYDHQTERSLKTQCVS